jgi:hypothetical protein
MNSDIVINPLAAQEFLREFPAWARRAGKQLLERGAVREWSGKNAGRNFTVVVHDIDDFEVNLYYKDDFWDSECACPTGYDCSHAYAAMLGLLYHQAIHPDPEPPRPNPKGRLDQRLAEVLKRKLNPEELDYVLIIQGLYQHCQRNRQLTGWELQKLGVTQAAYSWQPLQLWPAFPKDEVEFWNYLAYALNKWNGPIPEFMLAITDLELIAQRMAELERRQQIDLWRGKLEMAEQGRVVSGPQRPLDFRLVLAPNEVHLEWRPAGEDKFQVLKATQARQFCAAQDAGQLSVLPEAYPLWHSFFYQANGYVHSVTFNYNDPAVGPALNAVLRLPHLENRILTAHGVPFVRATQPLRWQLDPAQSEADDYRLRLLMPDGSAPDPIFVTLPGDPALYVSEKVIYPGPPQDQVVSAEEPNAIPAPALESAPGLQLLRRLGLELPPRIKERTEIIKLVPKLVCAVKPYYPGSPSEGLFLQVTAQSEAGKDLEKLYYSGWTPLEQPGPARSLFQRFGSLLQPQRRPTPPAPDKLRVYDREALREFPAALETLGAKWDDFAQSWRYRLGKHWPEKVVPWLQALPQEVRLQLEGDLASLLKGPVVGTVELECTEAEVDWFDIKVNLNVSDVELTPAELKALLDARGRFVRLDQKGWRRLQINLSPEEDERLARLGLSAADFSSEPQRLHALQLADDAASQLLPAAQAADIQRRVGELKARVNPPVPANVRATLRPYQVEGFHFLAYLSTNRFGGILADDMGLGKTVQALTWLAWLRAPPTNGQPGAPPKPALVVCPKSVMDNWRAEAERFVPDLRVTLWHGTDPAKLPDALRDTDVLVLNYAQLRAVGEDLRNYPWLAAILDEGQYIKNPDSQTAQAARALPAEFRLTLSGTPIENRLLDLWSLMAFAMPGMLGNRAQFAKRYDQPTDPLARRRLVARVRPFLLRRTKAQVAADLPDRVEEDLYCELEGHQKNLYHAEYKRARQMLLNIKTRAELNEFRFHFLTSLLRLRQICCHPALYDAGARNAASAKLNALFEILEPLIAEGHKVLVFSQFVSMLEILREEVQARDWPHFFLAGATENRGELIARFQAAPGAAVFLLSLKAGGFGLNLTAASYVVLFDPWWNPAVENQAIDRTHRIGQTSNVIAYRLLAKSSIEEKIRALQRQKSALAQGILGEENFTQSLTLEDLHFLFAAEDNP